MNLYQFVNVFTRVLKMKRVVYIATGTRVYTLTYLYVFFTAATAASAAADDGVLLSLPHTYRYKVFPYART